MTGVARIGGSNVQTRRIGSLDVSVVGIGCNNFGRRLDPAGTAAVIHAALDAGINFFDTADMYGGDGVSEEYMGPAFEGRRDEAIIATKFGMKLDDERQGAHPDYIRRAVEDSLRRLKIDYIDLYQLHQPDPSVPIADTLGAMGELVQAGKVREIGCSNFSAEQLREAEAATAPGAARFVSVQNQYNMLQREAEQGVLSECERLDIAFLPYSPIANGLLTGKFRQGQPVPQNTRIGGGGPPAAWLNDENLARTEALIAFAEARGHSILDLAFSWLLSRKPVASVIAGAMNPEQVQANASAANWNLTDAELKEIDAILAGAG
jgi:aryl-alcohol dehydrogenase-like predicted oxidoreductase